MAFLARYGGITPAEYDEMERTFTVRFAHQLARLRSAEIDLELNIARFVAGARIQSRGEEVR